MAKELDSYRYGDERISDTELFITISSMIMGVGILTLPRILARTTESSDGWLSIVLAGLLSMTLAWALGKLSQRFPGSTLFEYASAIASKPVAWVVNSVIFVYFLSFLAYEIRSISNISREYMFDKTPVEVVALAFVLIVAYAVSGARVGLIRLNLLFFPFVLLIVLTIMIMNVPSIHWGHLKPVFITPWSGIATGIKDTLFSIFGFEVVIFYAPLLLRPEKASKAAVIGVFVPMVLYIALHMFVIAMFSSEVARTVLYPTIELAKGIEVPGAYFERFESIFFTIWIMTIFNSAFMALDISIMMIRDLVTKPSKRAWVFILSPIALFISMIPQDIDELAVFGDFVSYIGLLGAISFPLILYGLAIVRGVKGNG